MASPQPQVTGEQLVAATPERNKIYQMGKLSKRQRGMHHPNTRNLKFQERWFLLNQAALEYYEKEDDFKKPNKAPRGTFPVRQIKIVEMVPRMTFGKDFCFQVGDDDEVLYLAAESLDEMDKWMKEFKRAAKDSGNNMLTKYHSGVYQRRAWHRRKEWSCCGGEKAKCEGCSQVERCQSEDILAQKKRSNSGGFRPQPLLMDHLPNDFLQISPSLPDLPLSPACRQLQLSDMIIPSSRIKLVETLGECNHVALWYNIKLLDTGCIDWTHWHMYQILIHTHTHTHTNIYIYSHSHAHTHI